VVLRILNLSDSDYRLSQKFRASSTSSKFLISQPEIRVRPVLNLAGRREGLLYGPVQRDPGGKTLPYGTVVAPEQCLLPFVDRGFLCVLRLDFRAFPLQVRRAGM